MRPINSLIGSGIEVIDTFHHVLGRPFADIAACVQNNQAHFVVWRSCETNLYLCMKSYADCWGFDAHDCSYIGGLIVNTPAYRIFTYRALSSVLYIFE